MKLLKFFTINDPFLMRYKPGLILMLAGALFLSSCQGPSTPDAAPKDEYTPAATAVPTEPPPSPTPDPRCQFDVISPKLVRTEPRDDTLDWSFSNPAGQAMDEDLLSKGLSTLDEYPALYSVLIIRNNNIVVEEYYNGQDRFSSHEIASASKSIISALVGIAIEEGYLTGVDQTLGELLPEVFAVKNYGGKSRLTVSNLLTMHTGFAWEPEIDHGKSSRGKVSLPSILLEPAESGAGGKFFYNTGATHLMSAAIEDTSGMSTCEFAYRYLFDPLDITVDWWNQDSRGYFTGGWNMYFTPRELAKFGLLYLNLGLWEGEQIVPENWVEKSTSYQVEVSPGVEPFYGYWWWLSSWMGHDIISARGGGGQMIYLVPDLDLVFVTTSDANYQNADDQFDSLPFLWRYVIPAVK